MIDSFFFIPADKKKYLNKISDINAEYFVIDFEDAVSVNNKTVAFDNIQHLNICEKTFFRLPVSEGHYNRSQLDYLVQKCEGRIVLPKINSVQELKEILNFFGKTKLSLILLVETPKCYVNIKNILLQYSKNIFGIGFGSHDFCSIVGMKHDLELLKTFKLELNTLAKSFDLKFIDGVDIDLVDFKNFEEECLFAFNIGVDGKFMIHPKQIEVAQNLEYISKDEALTIRKVYGEIQQMNINDIDILKLDGKIYEKPHLNRVIKLYNKLPKL